MLAFVFRGAWADSRALMRLDIDHRRQSADAAAVVRGSVSHRESIVVCHTRAGCDKQEVERLLKMEGKSDPDNSDAEVERRHRCFPPCRSNISDYILGIRGSGRQLQCGSIKDLVQDTKSKVGVPSCTQSSLSSTCSLPWSWTPKCWRPLACTLNTFSPAAAAQQRSPPWTCGNTC